MTTPTGHTPAPAPSDFDGPRFPLYSPEFAADPHAVYREMRRRHGDLVPVDLSPGVPAMLVIGYRTALQILNDPGRFPADPRTWEKNIPATCPVRPMMESRPNALRTAGAEHARYRAANVAALDSIDLYRLRETVEQAAIPLINAFCGVGHCDVLAQYALPVVAATLNELVGCTPDIGQRVTAGMAAMFDTVDAAKGNAMFTEALAELIAQKRATPGDDITSRLVQHPAGLTDEEMVHQLVTVYGAGIEPTTNLIANTLLWTLTEDRFGAGLIGGSLSTRDALDEVLFGDAPIANFCMSYPRQPVMVGQKWLPADQPVLISMAAANTDPEIHGGDITDNRSHLAFGAGPHACPAHSVAQIIARDALDQLLDALPETTLAIPEHELSWRPGGFHRSLAALPVTFPPSPPISAR